ncbi:hypothetical protein DFH28DRAFT_961069 [Melampsora americana]|nr:hypothetical protein DFH28DRAFT_961069 [Melampsora americana]
MHLTRYFCHTRTLLARRTFFIACTLFLGRTMHLTRYSGLDTRGLPPYNFFLPCTFFGLRLLVCTSKF